MASLQRLRLPLLGVGASAIAYWQHRRTTTTCLSASDEIQSAYAIGRTLGEGYYATVKLAKSYATGISYALKLVDKKKTADAGQDLEREVCVLKSAGQHRNLVSLVEEFDMPATKALVLELATGGELFDKLADEGSFSEHTAAELLRQVAEALQHLHQRGIVHNDLKPENLLLSCKGRKADLKLCDFGLARFIGVGATPITGANGTSGYMAPEILKGEAYGPEVDVWALGVIMFTVLSGYHPFDPGAERSDAEMNAAVRANAWDFDDECWKGPKGISHDARALIASLLDPDPTKRPSVNELLRAKWMAKGASKAPLPAATNDNRRNFNERLHRWRSAIRAAALIGRTPSAAAAAADAAGDAAAGGGRSTFRLDLLSADAIAELRSAFAAYDLDGNGSIDLEELRATLGALGAAEGEAERALKGADKNGDGIVTFEEFCEAVGPVYAHSDAALRRAFCLFDKDGSGFIERPEVEAMLLKLNLLKADAPPATVDRLMQAADVDGDGRVSFEEFKLMFAEPKGASAEAKARRAAK